MAAVTPAQRLAEHVRRGIPVFPCAPDKSPLTPRGFKDATVDRATVQNWYRQHRDALWAAPTGPESRLLVVDVDPDGAEWFAEHYADLACGYIVHTRRHNGRHLYYRYPDGLEIRNSASKIAPGVDVRAAGGYVILWDVCGHTAVGEPDDIGPPPDWLVELIREKRSIAKIRGLQQSHAGNGTLKIGSGRRNDHLAKLAGALAGEGKDYDTVLALVRAENAQRCDPPLDDDEIERTVAKSLQKWVTPDSPSELSKDEWPEPIPLPSGLPAVPEFEMDMLPDVLRHRVEDVAERMQCPPDYVAVAQMVVISSAVGRRRGIYPKQHDDWLVVPNLWGMLIGRPSLMKSPALREIMRPLRALEAASMEAHRAAISEYEADMLLREQRKAVRKDEIRKAIKQGFTAQAEALSRELAQQPEEPQYKRYETNDTTVEKLGELLQHNPYGLLLFRDELTGWFRTLERNGHEADRAFYLEAWNGDGSYTYDRIGRGTIHIPAVCLSVLGGIQPGRLFDLMRAMHDGSGDDGLIQRFQLTVYPDLSPNWRYIDRPANQRVYEAVRDLIAKLDALGTDQGDVPGLRFDAEAGEIFRHWFTEHETRLRSGDMPEAFEAHLSKYRSLVPALALLCALTEDPSVSSVSAMSLARAIAWAEYLEQHARRIYDPAQSPEMSSARALLAKIQARTVPDRFALRDVYRNQWSGLTTPEITETAAELLVEFDWLRKDREPTAGRTRVVYMVNPRAYQ